MHRNIVVGWIVAGSALFGACDEAEYHEVPGPPEEPRVVHVSVYGSDKTGDGTLGRPLETVREALTMVGPGDVIRLGGGDFYESVDVAVSGSPEAPITIEGTRGSSNELRTRLHAGELVDPETWTEHTGFGPVVYRNTSWASTPEQMVVDGRFVPRVHHANAHLLPLPSVLGFSPLEDIVVNYNEPTGPTVKFWQVIEGVYGAKKNSGITYMRLADGRDPRQSIVSVSSKPAISIKAAHVTVRGLNIDGGKYGVEVTGSAAHHVVLEGNIIAHGTRRVQIGAGAHDVTVRNNTIEMRGMTVAPGAWTGGLSDAADFNREYLYMYFKYVAGPSDTSDDRSIMLEGESLDQPVRDIVIEGNTVVDGLIALEVNFATNVEVQNNHFSNFSSGCLGLRPGALDLYFHDNVVENANFGVRPHNLGGDGGHRAYIYRNHFYLDEVTPAKKRAGTHVVLHADFSVDANMQDHVQTVNPEIYIYQNSFIGGIRGFSMPTYERLEDPFWLSGLVIVNNLISAYRPWGGNHQFDNPEFVGAFDGNWVGGGFAEAPCSQPGPIPKPTECDPRWDGRTYASMFWYNRPLPEPAPPEYPLWFDREGMGGRNQIARGSYVSRDDAADPNADVDAAVHNNGIDLSVRFLTNQKKFGPLPGMNTGYFGGSAPDIGAVQFAE